MNKLLTVFLVLAFTNMSFSKTQSVSDEDVKKMEFIAKKYKASKKANWGKNNQEISDFILGLGLSSIETINPRMTKSLIEIAVVSLDKDIHYDIPQYIYNIYTVHKSSFDKVLGSIKSSEAEKFKKAMQSIKELFEKGNG